MLVSSDAVSGSVVTIKCLGVGIFAARRLQKKLSRRAMCPWLAHMTSSVSDEPFSSDLPVPNDVVGGGRDAVAESVGRLQPGLPTFLRK